MLIIPFTVIQIQLRLVGIVNCDGWIVRFVLHTAVLWNLAMKTVYIIHTEHAQYST